MTRDFMDQDSVVLKLECYHLKSATHLFPTTNSLKKGTMLFLNATLNMKNLVILPWLSSSSDPPTNETDTDKVAITRTITSRVKNALNQNQNQEIQNPSTP
ncbi:hypothetical protein C2G38_2160916 [Gigaspora rosea]|uniref:Uncharacterized protein n=1 Tax=Gigaspora rosea TaxID=44941 RepID=A0A397W7J6_9GLOM|nr:hypothetical protein C2G38_2160916 [Gigaspora rosea]